MADKTKQIKQAVFALDPIGLKAMQEFQKSESDAAKSEKIERDDKSTHLSFILNELRKDESKRQNRMAFEVEPDTTRAAAGTIYRQKIGLTPDHLLKRIAGPQGDDLVNQILQARSNIMSSFGRPRTSRFAIGYEFQALNDPDPNRPEGEVEKEQKSVELMKELLWNCGKRGVDEDWSPNLSQFIKMITRDGLTFGRFAVEFVQETDTITGKKRTHSFRAVDAGTIYRIMPAQKKDQTRRKQALVLLQQIQNKKFDEQKYDNDEYKWVQVVGGRPVQVFTDQELVVYNLYPTTNIEFNGYPLTPIDQALNAISTHINITIHNKLYFEHGRAARGMLVFKSDDIDEAAIQKIRLQFHQSINSVQNCLDGSMSFWSKEMGQVTLADYIGDASEKLANIWTGDEWEAGLVYRSGKKQLIETTLSNGITLKSSPDHKFMTVNENGEMQWKRQHELKIDDILLSNKKSPVTDYKLPEFNCKTITPDFMEVLGWMTGDGTLGNRRFALFYNYHKEQEISDKHLKVLNDFGIQAMQSIEEVSLEEQERIKEKYDFKTTCTHRLRVEINSKEIADKIHAMGFKYSHEYKNIPGWIHVLPEKHKCAYLRGFFSADGNNAKGLSPCITICDERTREETKVLLLSVGIRTNLSEGRTKLVIHNRERSRIEAKSVLRIHDKVDFFEKIGFLQEHKQPVFNPKPDCGDSIPKHLAVKYLKEIRTVNKKDKYGERKLDNKEVQQVNDIISRDTCSKTRLEKFMDKVDYVKPRWMIDYNLVFVVDIKDTMTEVEMFDVAINNPEHRLMISGIYTSNSWRMPVFAVGAEDDVTWQSIETSGRDKEFQFLSDDTARVILGAFQISPEELPGYAHLARGSNSQTLSECLHPESKIYTESGYKSIEEVLGENKSVEIPVWTGVKWANALAFWTGPKSVIETRSSNGISVKTSPDHLFRSINENGELCWKAQCELLVGDTVLVNRVPVEGHSSIPKYRGKELTKEMFEVLGWITGDGNYSAHGKISNSIRLFYHHKKERDIWDKHFKIISEAGLSPLQGTHQISEEEADKIKERYGFKTVAPERIYTDINDTKFVSFMKDLGFVDSNNKKHIPPFLYTLPENYRTAFLRGLFSADGHIANGGSTVVLTAFSDSIRNGTKDLLLSLGIRTTNFEGTTKETFIGKDRVTVPAKNKLHIRDRLDFFNKIGFLQDHKQPSISKIERGMPSEKLPYSLQYKLIDMLINSDLPRAYKRDVYSFQRGSEKRCSLGRVKKLFTLADLVLPEWVDQFHYEVVSEIIDHNQTIQMVDLKLNTEDHMFVSNGFCLHNSDNEYQLTAARDVGLRPLIYDIQDFFNTHVFARFDEGLSKSHQIVLAGLEDDSPEKESTRLQQDMNVHMTYDDVLETVEKETLGDELGGKYPMNPAWQQAVAPFLTVGTIMENFFGIKGAAKDPRYNYMRDPFWIQFQQLIVQKAQMAMQNQMMAMQQSQPQPAGDTGEAPPEEGGGSDEEGSEENTEKREKWLEQNYQVLSKGINTNHNLLSNMILKRHTEIVDRNMEEWRKKSEQAISKIMNATKGKKET